MAVELPTDNLADNWPRKLHGARVGALLHPASVNSKLEHTARILEQENGNLFQLAALFGPQHGFRGETQDNMIEWRSYQHPKLHIPVHSLYADQREPTPEMLREPEPEAMAPPMPDAENESNFRAPQFGLIDRD